MIAPDEGTYSPKRVLLCTLKSLRTNSAWSDQDPVVRAREIASGCVDAGRADEAVVEDLTEMFLQVVSQRPRTVTAKMIRAASVSDRLRAVGSMDEMAGRAFSDGETAEISTGEVLKSVRRAIDAQGGTGAISPHLTKGRPVVHATISMPKGSRHLSDPLSAALGRRPGCHVVLERRDDGEDRIHYAILENTIRANLTAAVDSLPEPSTPFIVDTRIGDLHPLAWAVLQPTLAGARLAAMMGPTPTRSRREGTKPIRAYRDSWRRASDLARAFDHDDINHIERARARGLPDGLPPGHVMSEILGYVEARYRSSDAYLAYLQRLAIIRLRVPD